MRHLQDSFQQPILLGDFVAYTVRQGSGMDTKIGKVLGVTWDADSRGGVWSIDIIAAKYTYDYTERGYITKVYKTRLTANDTLVRLGNYAPEREKTAITAWLRENDLDY